jgi:cyclohexyl-isocyanide hydratase
LKIAFVILEGMVTLDFLGVYDPISRLKTMGFRDDIQWDICALTEEITDSTGQLTIKANVVKPNLSDYDMFIVPGGRGVPKAREDREFMDWIKAGRNARCKVGVCNGTLLLGEAGYLAGKKATTHRRAFEILEPMADETLHQRVVEDGDVITAGGITSSLDLGLYLVHKIAGPEVMKEIRAQMEYQAFDDAQIENFGAPLQLA